jgi:AAA-like domain
LHGFSLEQAAQLATAYGLDEADISIGELQQVLKLVGGHPYLVQLAMYWLRQPGHTCSQILQTAPTQAGIYTNHLRQHWDVLQQESELWTALQRVLQAQNEAVQLNAIAAYRLESMGLILLEGNAARIRCDLYQHYFSAQIEKCD